MEKSIGNNLERLAALGCEKRHMQKAFEANLSSDSIYHIAKAMMRSKMIGIITGFYIKDADAPETDGPLGAIALAELLKKIGKDVVLITDQHTAPLLKAIVEEESLKITIIQIPKKHSEKAWKALIKTYHFDHLIAIERPGKAIDGKYYTASGVDITDDLPDFDLPFSSPMNKKYSTSAIGDGGNEIGMGVVNLNLKDHPEHLRAVSRTDHLIISGTSNWGAHALCAMISIMTKTPLNDVHKKEESRLNTLIQNGAVDGLLKQCLPSVDGLSFPVYFAPIQSLVNQTPQRFDLSLSKYSTLIFDADETLFDFPKSEEEALRICHLKHGFDYDPNTHYSLYKTINAQVWSEFEKGLITQETLKTERFRRYLKTINLSDQIASSVLASSYMEALGNACYLYPDSEHLIEDLSKTHKLVILTNGLTQVQKNRIGRSPIAKYFKHIIISEEIGMAKPSPEIFDFALKSAGETDPSKVLMIGDSLTSDIAGGNAAGIDTCWFNPNFIINRTPHRPIFTVYTLKQLKKSI